MTPHRDKAVNSQAIAALNKAAVRTILRNHLGITGKEIAYKLGMSQPTVSRHVRAIRKEWLRR